jgi:hypothetical protein
VIFRQSRADSLRLHTASCRYCSQSAVPGTDLCEVHAGEAGRLLFNPKRAGYRSSAYGRARRAAIRRAGGKCEACGAAIEKDATGRWKCQAHHRDRDPTHNTTSNLLVCCPLCHAGSRRPAT